MAVRLAASSSGPGLRPSDSSRSAQALRCPLMKRNSVSSRPPDAPRRCCRAAIGALPRAGADPTSPRTHRRRDRCAGRPGPWHAPGELGPLLRHRAALGLDGRPLLGDLLGVGARPLPDCSLVHSAMLASTHSLRRHRSTRRRREDIVDPLPQRLGTVALVVDGAHAAGLDLLLEPVAGADTCRCRRAGCRCRGRPCWWRSSRGRGRRPGR